MTPEEFATIGLTLCAVGAIFLARSIVMKRTRQVVGEFFGTPEGKLSSIRHYFDAKQRVVFGSAFLILGFLVQVAGLHRRPPEEPPESTLLALESGGVVVLGLLAWVYAKFQSREALKRHLREFFQKSNWPFGKNLALTSEIGDLFGVPRQSEDTVEHYVARVRDALGLASR